MHPILPYYNPSHTLYTILIHSNTKNKFNPTNLQPNAQVHPYLKSIKIIHDGPMYSSGTAIAPHIYTHFLQIEP